MTKLKLIRGEDLDEANPHAEEYELPEPPPELYDASGQSRASEFAQRATEAREIWDRTCRSLRGLGLLDAADADVLVAYVEAVVNHRRATRVLRESPLLVKSGTGTMVRNPVLGIQNQAAQVIKLFAVQFGLSPHARATIEAQGGGNGDSAGNPFAEAVGR